MLLLFATVSCRMCHQIIRIIQQRAFSATAISDFRSITCFSYHIIVKPVYTFPYSKVARKTEIIFCATAVPAEKVNATWWTFKRCGRAREMIWWITKLTFFIEIVLGFTQSKIADATDTNPKRLTTHGIIHKVTVWTVSTNHVIFIFVRLSKC